MLARTNRDRGRCPRCRRPMHTALCLIALLLLSTSLATAQKLFPPSTFMCHGDDKSHRVCLFSNLVFCNGQLYYLSDIQPTLPELSGYRGTEPGPDIKVVAPRNLPCSGGVPATDIEVVPRSTLVYRMHSDNWFHTIIDIQPHLHQLLCKFFNFCSYVPAELAAVKILFYDDFPQHTAAFAETWKCYSSHPPIYLRSPEAASKPLLLKATLAGWTAAIFDGPNVAGGRHMGGLQAETWFQRVRTCTNTPITNHVVAMPRPVVTFIHRSFFDSRKARAFLNLHDTVDELRERFPHVDFRIVRLRAMTFQQIVRTFHDASVIFAVSGAAVSNVIWMRRGSVMIDIGFANYHPRWVESITHTIHPILGVFSQMMTLGDPLTTPTRWERVAKDPVFQALSKQEILDVLLHHRCPRTSQQAAYQCAALWTYFRSDIALPIDGMTQAVKTALVRLRDNGMTWALGDQAGPGGAAGTPKRALLGTDEPSWSSTNSSAEQQQLR